MFKRIINWFKALFNKWFGGKPELTPVEDIPPWEPEEPVEDEEPNTPPIPGGDPDIDPIPIEAIKDAPGPAADKLADMPLRYRPADNEKGWEEEIVRIAMQLPYKIKQWRDPATGVVGWVDYNPQPSTHDWYYIAAGVPDLIPQNGNWNALWIQKELIDTQFTEAGMERVRNYQGGLRSDPRGWPEPYRSAYADTHTAV